MKSERLMIASDIHGDAQTTKALLDRFETSGADRLILLGDILYHGPRNDLPAGYAPKKVIELLSPFAHKLICVRGNCDTEVDQMVLPFPILAELAYICADGIRMLATHGHKYSMTSPPPLSEGDVLLCGHTHVPAAEPFGNGNLYINPGSVSIPKEGSEKGYIIYENREFIFHSLDGRVLKKYQY